MIDSQCARLGRMLLRGQYISKAKSMEMHIGYLHTRMAQLGRWIREEISGEYATSYCKRYDPIRNLGSSDGITCKNKWKTNQAMFYLPYRYRRYLRNALKKRKILL